MNTTNSSKFQHRPKVTFRMINSTLRFNRSVGPIKATNRSHLFHAWLVAKRGQFAPDNEGHPAALPANKECAIIRTYTICQDAVSCRNVNVSYRSCPLRTVAITETARLHNFFALIDCRFLRATTILEGFDFLQSSKKTLFSPMSRQL